LNTKNTEWRRELLAKLESEMCAKVVNTKEEKLILRCTKTVDDKAWRNEIETELKKFLQQFALPREIDEDLKEDFIRESVNQVNETHPNSASYVLDNDSFFLVIKSSVLETYQTSPICAKLIKVQVKVPDFKDRSYEKIVDPIIKKFTQVFGGTYKQERRDQTITIKSLGWGIIEDVAAKLLKALNQIGQKRLQTDFEYNLTRCKGVVHILDNFFNTKSLLCSFDINEKSGINVIYLQNFPELNCEADAVFDEVQKLFNTHLTTVKIDVTRYKEFMSTQKWEDFRVSTLNDSTHRSKLTYTFYGNRFMLIFGNKENVFQLMEKVQNFLSQNDVVSQKIECLDREEVSAVRRLEISLAQFYS
jgi:hypothetical protein